LGKVYPELDERLRKFIARQSVFFVATAPCLTPAKASTANDSTAGNGGHVNVSPKGQRDTFAVLGPLQVAYLDLTGSGSETIAHLRQNGQITIMFCSFDHTAKILRLYGTGHVVLPGSARWDELAAHFPRTAAPGRDANGRADGNGRPDANGHPHSERSIIVVDVQRIADSCGYGVPEMELTRERDLMDRWAEKKSPEALAAYRVEHNTVSIDGLPALDQAATY
jgi:hypothetical protein